MPSFFTLTLTIAIDTALFAAFNATLLRPLPAVRDPQQLAATLEPVSYPYIEQYRATFPALAGFMPTSFTVSDQRVYGQIVSPEYFSVLGIPASGLVISDHYWRTRLHSDPHAVGGILQINGQPVAIGAVAPPGFRGVFPYPTPAEIFIPTTAGPAVLPQLAGDLLLRRDIPAFRVLIRLAPGATLSAAEKELNTIATQLDQQFFDEARGHIGARGPLAYAGYILEIPHETARAATQWITLFLLLIPAFACVSLANFQMVRGVSLASVALAGFLGSLIALIAAAFEPLLAWDWRVPLFTLAIAAASGVALRLSSTIPLRPARLYGIRHLTITAQVVLALVLLLIAVDPGAAYRVLWGFAAGLVGFLAAVGLAGVTRFALFLDPKNTLKQAIQPGFSLGIAGIAIGLALAFEFSLAPASPALIVEATLLLTLVALLACYLPARRLHN